MLCARGTAYLRTAGHADFCENIDRQDHHPGSGVYRYNRHAKKQDPRQRGHPSRPTAADFCWEAAGGRSHASGLQHSEGVDSAFGSAAAGRRILGVF